jgi:hypothetical protein
MNQPGTRPGGLTALAVINFVFAGLGALAVLALFALMSAADAATDGQATKEVAKAGGGLLVVSLLIAVACVALLIVSGVGYLGQKKFLGRHMGTLYAVLALVNTAISLTMMKQGFTIGTAIGLIYPVLTLILLNTTFKDDLVR